MADEKDEQTLMAIAQLMNPEGQAMDPRLERLASGELGQTERAALLEDAARDPSLARDVALMEPMSAVAKERFFQAAATGLKAPVIVLSALLKGGVALALAAGLAAVMFVAQRPPPLAPYTMTVDAAEAEFRGDEPRARPASERNSVRRDTPVTIVLKPATPIEGALEAQLYVLTPQGPVPSPVRAEISAQGAVRWKGPADRISGGRLGAVDCVAVITRMGVSPSSDAFTLAGGTGGGWYAGGVRVFIRDLEDP